MRGSLTPARLPTSSRQTADSLMIIAAGTVEVRAVRSESLRVAPSRRAELARRRPAPRTPGERAAVGGSGLRARCLLPGSLAAILDGP